MKMRILLRIKSSENKYIAHTCWPKIDCGNNLISVADSRSEANSMISVLVSIFIEEFGRQYIESTEFNSMLNCPQSKIQLPVDTWYCKTTNTPCPTQGQLDMSDPDGFYKLCLLSEEIKNGIWNAIITGTYKGFHHMPGRYRCGLCDNSRMYFNYHYPWELTFLNDHCDITSIWNDINRVKELILSGFPREAISSALCSECFLKASKFLPEINVSEYEIINYEYLRNK